MTSPLLSVIVPVYNVERYLRECLDSILASTFTNYELLLIDDGSTDSSGSICDDYSRKDARVKAFHKQNGGVSSARNVGIEHAQAEWITFVDADDMVAPTFWEHLYQPVIDHPDVDFVQAGCLNYEGGKSTTVEQKYDYYVGNDKVKLLNLVRGLTFSKLFKTDFLRGNGCLFDVKLHSAEDLLFSLEYIIYVDKYVFIPETGYLYRRDNQTSLTHTLTPFPYEISLHAFKRRYAAVTTYTNKYRIKTTDTSIRYTQLAALLEFAIYNGLYSGKYVKKRRIANLRNDFTKGEMGVSKYCTGRLNSFSFFLLRNGFARLFDVITCFFNSGKGALLRSVFSH